LVYLGIVLDGFVAAAEIDYRGDFGRMARDLKQHGGSLRRFLAKPENTARWTIMKNHSYGGLHSRVRRSCRRTHRT
jgi:hypothetical protein